MKLQGELSFTNLPYLNLACVFFYVIQPIFHHRVILIILLPPRLQCSSWKNCEAVCSVTPDISQTVISSEQRKEH